MEIDQIRQEILDAKGHLLILGGPGCGKTTIALLKAQATLHGLEPGQRALFLSFSRAAVRQITDRMSGLLTRSDRDRLEVRTFHALFLDIVASHGRLLTGGASAFITPDRERQMKADFDGDWTQERRRLADEGRYVFDLLADTVATLLEGNRAVSALYSDLYPLVIVDEFQDTNLDQWRVVKALSTTSTVICLADPDQRIFDHIEGVEEKRIDDAISHLDPTPFDLSADNHRSPGSGLLDYANAVLRNDPAVQPAEVGTAWYPPPGRGVSWQIRTHQAIRVLDDALTKRLGQAPTIAVLATANSLLGQLSESLSLDHTTSTGLLPAVEHHLQWDPELSAAAGYVVASIMEWPCLRREPATIQTLQAIGDFYRIKAASGAQGARSKIQAIDNAIIAFTSRKPIRSKTAQKVIAAHAGMAVLTGDPVADWRTARGFMHSSTELDEIFKHARLVRLLKATDALAWGLSDTWDSFGYANAASTVRAVLASETLNATQQPAEAVSLMSMHRSKGKEFDGVVIVEGTYASRLLDPMWGAEEVRAKRRLLRVAITRARHAVIFVRPQDGFPLTRPARPTD